MFQHRIGDSYSDCCTNSYCELINHLRRTIHNIDCNSINRRRNLFLGSGWTNYCEHYCVSCFYNNLYCHL